MKYFCLCCLMALSGCGMVGKIGKRFDRSATSVYKTGRDLIIMGLPIAIEKWKEVSVDKAVSFVHETYAHMTKIKSVRQDPASYNQAGVIGVELALFNRSLPPNSKSKKLEELGEQLEKYSAWGAIIPFPDILIPVEFEWENWRDYNLMLLGAYKGGVE